MMAKSRWVEERKEGPELCDGRDEDLQAGEPDREDLGQPRA